MSSPGYGWKGGESPVEAGISSCKLVEI